MKVVYDCIAEFEGDWTKMTCGGCCRFKFYYRTNPKGYHCTCGNVKGIITADHTACKDYWDREEQEQLDRQRFEEQTKKREKLFAEKENRQPVKPDWTQDYDGMRDCMTEPYPICPDCGNPLFSLADGDRCEYCGRKIEITPELKAYYEPPEVMKMDCFKCGGKGTLECIKSRYNGHMHGRCTNCGMSFME